MVTSDPAYFDAGDVVLQCGVTLPDARLAYTTHGSLNDSKDNAILFPTRYGGRHEDNEYLVGRGQALDPERYLIIIPNLLGNGVSSSPSNTAPPLGGAHFPKVTIHDNVVLQHRLCVECLGVHKLALAVGWSMGGQQAYEWATWFPDMVPRLAVICGSARTTPHTHVFLEGMKAALMADAAWNNGEYTTPPTRGLRAMARAWAGWALPQAFYREELFHAMGYSSVEDFLLRYWEGLFLTRDANNLLSMIGTWQDADVSANERFRCDFEQAMGAIEATTIVMPCASDLYFPPEDSAEEVSLLRQGQLLILNSSWGHYAGGGNDRPSLEVIDRALTELLGRVD
jgi:homoserine O-acetyltransferase/O-succinyltransferase